MPHGRVGGETTGGTIASEVPGTFTATASSSGTARFPINKGFLTELSIRVNGDVSIANITGGPVKIEAWLKRATILRHLCSGAIQAELSVKGSGQLPVLDSSEIVVKWTELSGANVVVRVDAFIDESAQGDSAPGWTDETPRTAYIYHGRRVATQANGAGGAIIIDISLATGQFGNYLNGLLSSVGANHSLGVIVVDEDNAQVTKYANVSSVANPTVNLPGLGAVATATNTTAFMDRAPICPGQKLSFYTGEAGAQNDTLTVAITLLLTTPDAPTWAKDRSTNEADVTLAASTISGANSWQIVRYPL